MLEAGASTIPIIWPNGPFMPRKGNWSGSLQDWLDHANTLSEAERVSFAGLLPPT